MNPTRRGALGIGLAATGIAGVLGFEASQRMRGSDEITPIDVQARPISSFRRGGAAEERRFGELSYRSGLVLTSPAEGFGGLSGLWRHPDGIRLVAVTDRAQWLTASIRYESGRLAGLSGPVLAPILDEQGVPLRGSRAYDTEALAIAEDGSAYVGIERVHQVRRFAWARDGVRARGVVVPMPPEAADLPANGSFESLAVAPAGHPLAGAVIAIAEEARSGVSAPTRGWVLTGSDRFAFDVARSEDFDITDASFLASGELLLLERRYSLVRGAACRIRRVATHAIRPDATIDGRVIFEVDRAFEIDNMEGLGLHQDPATGQTVVTLLSDDNFSPIQRTVLLEFTLGA